MPKATKRTDPETMADVVIQSRLGVGCFNWLEKKRHRYQEDRGRRVSQSEFLRHFLEGIMLDERRRAKT